MSQEADHDATARKRRTISEEVLKCLLESPYDPLKALYAVGDAGPDTPASLARFEHLVADNEERGLDMSTIRALHCVRCHTNYLAQDNDDTSCWIEHDEPEPGERNRGEDTCIWEYGCCGTTQRADFYCTPEEDPHPAQCFVGPHTTDRLKVDSNGIRCAEYRALYNCSTCNYESADEDNETGGLEREAFEEEF
ncbi:hypothetical protein B0H10DRAFT_2081976 [Mycena sp. CBHHK59/15]|nr:hypothetical protein B0H10DRAFT_2081976 [Mycena sp. CBHHK59/15]